MSKKTLKKLHKWPGLIIALIMIYFAFSGIIMNHRKAISGIDIPRQYLPNNYQYKNWNLAALKGNIKVGNDSILIYGNIGIWLTDSSFGHFTSFNQGFSKGTDNRKIFDVHNTEKGNLYAATLNGLFAFNRSANQWQKLTIKSSNQHFVAIQSKQDTIFAINRSHLFKGKDNGISSTLTKIEIPASKNYQEKVSLFKTLWQIHSGEILGLPGKLFVDLMGIVTIFISFTGIIFFFFPKWIRRRKRKNRKAKKIIQANKWSLKWHNKTGEWFFIVLIVLYLSGMFLRPPLLIPIANVQISPVKYTHLDQPNPWYDKLRDLCYDPQRETFIIGTSEGLFHTKFKNERPKKFENQPPISVMGITVLEPFREGAYLIGSFSGLYLWHPSHPEILDYAKGEIYASNSTGRPFGQNAVSGLLIDKYGNRFMVDYTQGVKSLHHKNKFPAMPKEIKDQSNISLWNFSLELHTGRIFSNILGDFYILIVPIVGIIALMVIISGYLMIRKRNTRKTH